MYVLCIVGGDHFIHQDIDLGLVYKMSEVQDKLGILV